MSGEAGNGHAGRKAALLVLCARFGPVVVEELDRAAALDPERAGWLEEHAFALALPTESLAAVPLWLYRAHCRELFERVRTGEDTRLPTWAEWAGLWDLPFIVKGGTPTLFAHLAQATLEAAALVGHHFSLDEAHDLLTLKLLVCPRVREDLASALVPLLFQKHRTPEAISKQTTFSFFFVAHVPETEP